MDMVSDDLTDISYRFRRDMIHKTSHQTRLERKNSCSVWLTGQTLFPAKGHFTLYSTQQRVWLMPWCIHKNSSYLNKMNFMCNLLRPKSGTRTIHVNVTHNSAITKIEGHWIFENLNWIRPYFISRSSITSFFGNWTLVWPVFPCPIAAFLYASA